MSEGVRRRYSLSEVSVSAALPGDEWHPGLLIVLPGGEVLELVADSPQACRKLRGLGRVLDVMLAEVEL